MKEINHVQRIASCCAAMLMTLLAAVVPLPTQAAAPGTLPTCQAPPTVGQPISDREVDWRPSIDGDGILRGHVLALQTVRGPLTLETGTAAFAVRAGAGRILLGERGRTGTTISLLDAQLGCRIWQRSLDILAYDVEVDEAGAAARLVAIDPTGRAYRGTYQLSLGSAADLALLDETCSAACAPSDGLVVLAGVSPAGLEPVPVYAGPRWAQESDLRYRWHPTSAPPTWARTAIRDAASDAGASRQSRAPTFTFHDAADELVRYTDAFPNACRFGIACASRDLPEWWTVYLRPHETDYSWGVLRWCQQTDIDGCFDIERTSLHEFGHVDGLRHPDEVGLRLAATDTVMHSVIPARPAPGSLKHAFGRCDVAALQLLYSVSPKTTPISTCLQLDTKVTLEAQPVRQVKGGSVTLTARLSIADRSAYTALAGDPLKGRSLKLRFRRAGSDDAWTTAWMEGGSSVGTYTVVLTPPRTWEYQAVFSTPTDEGLVASKSAVISVPID